MLEPFLTVLDIGGAKAVLCSQHGCCYTQESLDRHLQDKHGIRRGRRTELLAELHELGLAARRADIPRLPDARAALRGLPIHRGLMCSEPDCSYISIQPKVIAQHCRTSHGKSLGPKGRKSHKQDGSEAAALFEPVAVQTLWTKTEHIDYFVVQEDVGDAGTALADHSEAPFIDLAARYRVAQEEQKARATASVQAPAHVSELTPWLKETGFLAHLEGMPLDEIASVYRLPDDTEDAPELGAICECVDRLLEKGIAMLADADGDGRRINRLNCKLINTFRRDGMSQDPIRPLQNAQSRKKYIQTWQQLLCYFFRVSHSNRLQKGGRPPFRRTAKQRQVADIAWALAGPLDPDEEGGDDEGEDEKSGLDLAVLELCMSLIQHPLDGRSFDSAMVSFAAVLAWDTTKATWKDVNNYTSYLSQIVYDCQIVVLLHCDDFVKSAKAGELGRYITHVRDAWLLNDTIGPVAELLGIRLLGFGIGRTNVSEAQVRWHADGQTIVFRDVQLSMDNLKQLIAYELAQATTVLAQDLCFGLEDVPRYRASEFVDNWDATSPGQSFLTDPRNEDIVIPGSTWLLEQHRRQGKVVGALYTRESMLSASADPWRLNSTGVAAYEVAVQRFLESMMVLLHIGSGQPARRPEFLGLRWCNRQADVRNMFVQDGYLCFILKYHKSLNMTHSSRFPVRFLLHKAEELLLRYLVLIQPFRIWLSRETGQPRAVSEYLWHDGNAGWTDDRMTAVLKQHSQGAIGVELGVKSWRQIAVGIAIKKLSGHDAYLDLDTPADGHAGVEGVGQGGGEHSSSMPEALHWQASHNPRTGNAVYGGTVNFRGGLTDAGLQEYLAVSQMWHSLVWGPDEPSGRKHARQESREEHRPSLVERLAFRTEGTRGCQTIWTAEQALESLRHMYGPGAAYRSEQERAVQAIISNRMQVVVVLATGDGKSLLYQLPSRLPGAGTTVLIVPLVALKLDTVRKCREFGIKCVVWQADQPPSPGCPLLLISIEEAVAPRFQTYAHQLNASEQLARVVIDESHLVCTADSYREKMGQVKQLRKLRCQFVLLTATLPPSMQRAFEAALLLQRPYYIRSPTTRIDLQYEVYRVPATPTRTFLQAAVSIIRETLAQELFVAEGPTARALVFARTKRLADQVADALGCLRYHSESGSKEERASTLAEWIRGDHVVLVATSALAGLDYKHVRVAVHVDEPSGGAVNFAQDVGRLARDGRWGVSIVLVPATWQPLWNTPQAAILPESERIMHRFLDSPRCRKLPLSEYLDGAARSCQAEEAACDRCIIEGRLEITDAAPQRQELARLDVEPDTQSADRDIGSALVQQHHQRIASRLRDFVYSLDTLRGSCMICRVLAKDNGADAEHSLKDCRSEGKRQFLEAKRAAVAKGRETGRGWLAKYSACYGCGNVQAVCPQQGKGGCRYQDMIMPLAWAAAQRADWQAELLGDLPYGAAARAAGDEGKFMQWLGEGAVVFEGSGTNLALVAERAIQLIMRPSNIAAANWL